MPGKSKKGGGLESKPAYNLEPVPTDKQKSLGKLPTKVRNKMGYEMKPRGYQMNYKMVNKEGFKMAGNPAYKLDPTISLTGFDPKKKINFDPSKLSALNIPSINDIVNYDNESMSVSDVNINETFRTKTYDDMRAAGASEEDIIKAKAFNTEKYGTINPTAAGKTNNQTLDSFNAVVNLASIPQPGAPEVKGDAFTSYDKRQRARGIKFEENLISRKDKKGKRLGEVIGKLEGKEKLNKKQERRLANLKSRQTKNTRIKDRLEDVNKISKKQDLQGINPSVGKKDRVILEAGKPGSSTTPSKLGGINVSDSERVAYVKNKLGKPQMKPMQLSPKAMNYFSKKNKK